MKKLKLLIVSTCFKIIDKLIDESQIVKCDPELERQIEKLVEGVDVGPSNKVVERGQANYSLKPCPCTATKTNQCGEWCTYYPPAC
ncbi:MAG: hypothetical protein GY941_23555 [Planctomycetes bacterium]|nr:hypothetical protein [Planctomycetota bacterium]